MLFLSSTSMNTNTLLSFEINKKCLFGLLPFSLFFCLKSRFSWKISIKCSIPVLAHSMTFILNQHSKYSWFIQLVPKAMRRCAIESNDNMSFDIAESVMHLTESITIKSADSLKIKATFEFYHLNEYINRVNRVN